MHDSQKESLSKSKLKIITAEVIENITTNSAIYSIVGVLLFFIIVQVGFKFNGLYGQDAHEYLRYGRALYHFFLTGTDPGDYFWPINFPFYGAILSLLFRNVNFSMQILSIFSFIGIIMYTTKIFKYIFVNANEKSAFFIFCFLVLCPLLLRASVLIMSDVLCMFFIVGSFYHYFKFKNKEQRTDLYLLVFYSFSAVMTRYPAAIVLLPPGILTLIKLMKAKMRVEIFFSMCIAGMVLLPHILIRANQSAAFISHEFLTDWSVRNFLKSEFITLGGGSEKHQIPNIIYSFYNIIHPGYFFIGTFLIFFFKRKDVQRHELKVMWISVLLYAAFLSGVPYQNLRYVMLTFPLVLTCLYPTFLHLYNFISERKLTIPVATITLITQVALFSYVFNMSYRRNLFEREVFYTLDSYPKNVLYTFDLDVALTSYETKHQVINLLTKDLSFKKGEMILFNERRFAPQWEHTNLGSNWKNLKSTHQLVPLKELKDGWELYEIR